MLCNYPSLWLSLTRCRFPSHLLHSNIINVTTSDGSMEAIKYLLNNVDLTPLVATITHQDVYLHVHDFPSPRPTSACTCFPYFYTRPPVPQPNQLPTDEVHEWQERNYTEQICRDSGEAFIKHHLLASLSTIGPIRRPPHSRLLCSGYWIGWIPVSRSFECLTSHFHPVKWLVASHCLQTTRRLGANLFNATH